MSGLTLHNSRDKEGTAQLSTNEPYRKLAQSYYENIIAYRCISHISRQLSSLPLIFSVDGNTEGAEVNRLIESLDDTENSFKEKLFDSSLFWHIKGEVYFYADTFTTTGRLESLRALNPSFIQKQERNNRTLDHIRYTQGTEMLTLGRDDNDMLEFAYLKNRHPNSLSDGLSPIVAGSSSLGQFKEGSDWNASLMKNGAKPSGIYSMGEGSENVDQEVIQMVQKILNEKLSGNKGGVAVSNMKGKLDMFGLSPVDMDFINGLKHLAVEICNAFHYPPYLLGLDGATFNNQAEAKIALYEEAVLPLADMILDKLNSYLSYKLQKSVIISVDLNSVSALSNRREEKRKSVREDFKAGIISLNEARETMSLEAIEGGDEIFVDPSRIPLSQAEDLASELMSLGSNAE